MNIELPVTDRTFVETIIPQKKPFVMVDSLLEFSEEALQSAFTVLEVNIFVHEGFFQASGVLEHQAQSVALHTGYQYFLKNEEPPVGYIGAVKMFEIYELPKTGQQLVTDVDIISEIMGVTLVKTSTSADGKLIAVSEMKTAIKP